MENLFDLESLMRKATGEELYEGYKERLLQTVALVREGKVDPKSEPAATLLSDYSEEGSIAKLGSITEEIRYSVIFGNGIEEGMVVYKISYEEYCSEVVERLTCNNRMVASNTLRKIVNRFAIEDLKSNIVTPKKSMELRGKAFEIKFDRKPTSSELRDIHKLSIGVTRMTGEYSAEGLEKLREVAKIYNSYLDILNLKAYTVAKEELIDSLGKEEVANKYYISLSKICYALHHSDKDEIYSKFELLEPETIDRLNKELLKEIDNIPTVYSGNGLETLVISKQATGKYVFNNRVIHFIEHKGYDTLVKYGLLDLDKYREIKVVK